MKAYDFSGWATRNDLKCADGRTIRRDAFKDQNGATVPLVWQHMHNDPANVLGHAVLENRPEGVYTYGYFNNTEGGQYAKELVMHGDVESLSIYANKLKQDAQRNVLHGAIREVSLVLAGANPGAIIDNVVLTHGENSETVEDEAVAYLGGELYLAHADAERPSEDDANNTDKEKDMADNKEKTVKDVFDSLTEDQKNVVYFMIGEAIKQAKGGDDEDNDEESASHDAFDDYEEDHMKHNVFESDNNDSRAVLAHSDMQALMADAIADAKRFGSLKDAIIAHAEADYGIENIDFLFPDAKTVTNTPDFIKRETAWVAKVMNGVKHSPFSRIKSIHADITDDEARAKGYIKGNEKKEEVFTLLKRVTTPTTVYKKQKLDRDDVIDITDFDVIAWLKQEMRIMLDEEIARAILVGDGRLSSSNDKISELCIRPIWKDDQNSLYAVPERFAVSNNASEDDVAKAFIRKVIKARKDYKGSGDPTLFTTEDMVTNCLLLEDSTGRVIYDSEEKLRTTLRVKEIVTVPVMEGLNRVDSGTTYYLDAILVNLRDYTVGADKGGAISMFDDFDIDYNQMKYLMEGRCSGALTAPKSALVIEHSVNA